MSCGGGSYIGVQGIPWDHSQHIKFRLHVLYYEQQNFETQLFKINYTKQLMVISVDSVSCTASSLIVVSVDSVYHTTV